MNKLQKLKIRVSSYYYKRGLLETINNLFRHVYRLICQRKYYIYCADLNNIERKMDVVRNISVVCRKSKKEMSNEEINDICLAIDYRIWNDECEDRFIKGAWLWLAFLNGRVAGFVWAINKLTIKPYFFPLRDKDIHLFDNMVLEEYRGNNINKAFIDTVLRELGQQGYEKAYIETKMWNHQEIKSLEKTMFRNIGVANNYILFKKVILSDNINGCIDYHS